MGIKYYQIGQAGLMIEKSVTVPEPEHLELFRIDDPGDAERISYELKETDEIRRIADEELRRGRGANITRPDLTVISTDSGESRLINFRGEDLPYAVSIQRSDHSYQIWYRKGLGELMLSDPVFYAPFCLEKIMIERKALILHSAYMCLDGAAVLFSAPSETGKSTQAGLWEQYRGTYQVNGDRSLLIREPDGWKAWSWPICGSSEICRNEVHPIRAIVMLRQAKVNRAYRFRGIQAVMEVLSQITVNSWNREFQLTAMDLLDQLLTEVPVYRLECDISEDAVNCLEKVL